MTVGYPIGATDINNRAGGLVVALWNSLADVRAFKQWLDDAVHTDAFLNSAGITGSVSTGDVKTLRDSFADLGGSTGLYAVAHGTFTPGGNNNFFANAKNLSGITYTG